MFEKYNDFNKEELLVSQSDINIALIAIRKNIKKYDKEVKRPCWWVMIIPVFGFFLFNSMVRKRKEKTGLGEKISLAKTEELYLELELKIIEKKIETL